MVPSVILANRLNIKKLYTFGLTSYDGNNQRGEIEAYYDPALLEIDKDAKILVVDDILDSGSTFKYIEKYFSEKGYANITNYALHYKVIGPEQYIPSNFMYSEIVDAGTWIEYAWEKKA